jgi:hypothetical protein
LRIIIFTILIGIVWWFVIPWAGLKMLKTLGGKPQNLTEEQKKEQEKIESFSELVKTIGFGGEMKISSLPIPIKWDAIRKFNREEVLEKYERKLAKGGEKVKNMTQQDQFFM